MVKILGKNEITGEDSRIKDLLKMINLAERFW